jgi:RNA polymerase sigma-70 factor, ECF subfamily
VSEDLEAALAAARTGDAEGITVLFHWLHPSLLRFVRAHERGAADDITAETWLAVTSGLGRFEGDSRAFRAWVFSIARRRLADHRRRAVRRRTDPADPASLEAVLVTRDGADGVVGALSGQQAADLVVALLPRDQADVVLLRVLADLDVTEVAELLGRSPNWVRVTQHRALRRLAARLGSKIEVMR